MTAADSIGITGSALGNHTHSRTFSLTTEWIIFGLFVVGLTWVPFWLGSNRLIAWGINAALFSGLAAIFEFSLLLRGLPHPMPLRCIAGSAVLFAGVILWVVIQNTIWTPPAWHHPIWQLASDALGRDIAGSISVDRDLTALALLRLITAASVFWLAMQLCRNSGRARLLIWSVIGIGTLYAAVGLFALGFMPNGRLFEGMTPSKFVTSTFVNQNHYVTFAGIGLIAAIASILRLYRRELGRSGRLWRLKIAALIRATGSKCAVPLAFTSVIVTSLLLTGSRGGIIATTLGIFILLILNVKRAGSLGRSDVLLLVLAALLVGIAFIGFGDVFVERINERGLYDEGRRSAPFVILSSILSAPFLGFGYGTFSAAFPMFRDDSMTVVNLWDKAHNTYLEILQGLGVVFGAMLIACVALLVLQCLKGARTRRRDATIPTVAASVSFLVGVHALLDFSLQIQAVTLTYMAVLGAGVAQARD